jgi:2-polyprenyl-3-methyl-5-hydroxy-6-metoxy-1,4-benzoquinol methylase/ribosomal protein S27E
VIDRDGTFTEMEIRPDALMKGQAEAVAVDIEWLRARRGQFVLVDCPACASDRREAAFQKAGFEYVNCLECGSIYVCPRPAPDVLADFYASSKNYAYWNKHLFPASEEARREKIVKPRVARLADIFRRNGVIPRRLMEVGAGFGTFCEEALHGRLCQQILAVEATPELAQTCRDRGIDVIEGPFENVDGVAAESTDAIVAFEVLEHLFSPRDFFIKSWALLAPRGVLIVTCPNIRGFDLVVLGSLSATIDHEHLNYFHPRSIMRLASECGFDTLEILTPGKLDAELVRKKVLSNELDLQGQPFLMQVLIDEWNTAGPAFQQFLSDHLLSSHMWLVAQKR